MNCCKFSLLRKLHRQDHSDSGFTIVELLVVIVVIGILAAITIVTYTGISQKAIASSLQSDLTNASTQLKMYLTENSAYPNSVIDCPTPSAGNMCLKSSPGNSYSNYAASNASSPQTFTLTASNSNGTSYIVTDSSQPTALAAAPLNPSADWLATVQGDHYGNFYDQVSHSYATVSRSTPKTIYDPTTNHIYDVPANYLGVNPRSDGKGGSEAVIEESRTNSFINGDVENGLTNFARTWTNDATLRVVNSGVGIVHGGNGLEVTTSTANASGVQGTVGTLATSTKYTLSVFVTYISGDKNNLSLGASDGAGTRATLGLNDVLVQNVSVRVTLPWTSSASPDTLFQVWNSSVSASPCVFRIDAIQVEAGAFATSYIPTTTAAVTRNADVVTVPTTNWNASAGTIVAASGLNWPLNSYRTFVLVPGTSGNQNRIWFFNSTNTGSYFYGADAVNANPTSPNTQGIAPGSYSVNAMNWTPTSVQSYNSNVGWGSSLPTDSAVALNSTAHLGEGYAGPINGPMQRITVYSSTLSPSDVTTVTNAVKNGP